MPTQFSGPVRLAGIPLLGRLLKLRYLIFGSAVGGGYAVHNKFNEISESLPDISWIKQAFPEDVADTISSSYARVLQAFSTIDLENFKKRAAEMRENAVTKFTKRCIRLAATDKSSDENVLMKEARSIEHLVGAQSKTSKNANDDKEPVKMREEMTAIQAKYQKEIERIEQENKLLKSRLLLLQSKQTNNRRSSSIIKKSLIDMYSEVLDDLSDFDSNYRVHDQLPRVVVIGDQSSGKTSVLEMITQARIFPRGAGEMKTRSPVKVTLSEGPYHVAEIKGLSREFDLNKDEELKDLREEIDRRMRASVTGLETISKKVISLNIKGPGLQRMVLIDLPGIISTETQGMATNTKNAIIQLAADHMSNPNAIILCIQDGSVDAERSNVTDLVSSIDKDGKRTIFVLTKIDMAEDRELRPDRIQQILDGKLFPMKALGYFAVVTGTAGDVDASIAAINEYERNFFKESKLVKEGILRPSQISTRNLSLAVSDCFWNMVKSSIEAQADAYRATRYNLEAEWKNMYPKMREQCRDDLYDRARNEILDQLLHLSNVTSSQWQQKLHAQMWQEFGGFFINDLLLPSWQASDRGTFNTRVDIALGRAINEFLPSRSVEIARELLLKTFEDILKKNSDGKSHDTILNKLEASIMMEVQTRFKWDSKAVASLKLIQDSLLEDKVVNSRDNWDKAVRTMGECLKAQRNRLHDTIENLIGPSTWNVWFKWQQKPSPEQNKHSVILEEMERILYSKQAQNCNVLRSDQTVTLVNNTQNRMEGEMVSADLVNSLWPTAYQKFFLDNCILICAECSRFFPYYQKNFTDQGLDCREVEYFWRLERIIDGTSNALRMQISSIEARRLERIIKEVLDDMSKDEIFKAENLDGRRVELAERLAKVRSIQHHLDEFMISLNKE